MSHQPLPQRQLFTVRQVVAALSIVACLGFIVSYSGRIIMDSKVQETKVRLENEVASEQAYQERIREWILSADSPDQVEKFARQEFKMQLPGERAVVPLPRTSPQQVVPEEPVVEDSEESAEPPNWELWLDLLESRGDLP